MISMQIIYHERGPNIWPANSQKKSKEGNIYPVGPLELDDPVVWCLDASP